MSRKEKIDLFLSKWVSRKLTVFVVADITSLVNFLKHNFAGYNQISEEVVNEVIN
jgi:hypothetical protein